MTNSRQVVAASFMAAALLYGQPTEPTFSEGQVQYFRSLFFQLGSTHWTPQLLKAREGALADQFGLDQRELAAIRTAVSDFGQHEQSRGTVIVSLSANKKSFSPSDLDAIAQIEVARAQDVKALVLRLFSELRPLSAERMKAPGTAIDEVLKTRGAK